MFRTIFVLLLSALILVGCSKPQLPWALEGSWVAEDVAPSTLVIRSAEIETMGVVESVSYRVEGDAVVVRRVGGPMAGGEVTYRLLDKDTLSVGGFLYRRVS